MATSRQISTDIGTDEQLNMVSDQAALLFTWCIARADPHGYLPGKPGELRLKVVPGRKWTDKEVAGYLKELEATKTDTDPALVEWKYPHYVRLLGWEGTQKFLYRRPESIYLKKYTERVGKIEKGQERLAKVEKATIRIREEKRREEK